MTLLESRNPHPLTIHYRPTDDGFRPECGCTWRGGLYADVHAAAAEARDHAMGAA